MATADRNASPHKPANFAGREAVQHRLDAPRGTIPFGRPSHRADYGSLKQTFSELARRSLDLFGDPRLKVPETARLFEIAGEALSLTRVAHRELERLGTPHAVLFNAQVVSDALDGIRRHLEYLADQLQRLDRIGSAACTLQPLLEQLHQSRTTDSAPLWELVREIADESGSATNPMPVIVPEGVSLVDYLRRSFKPGESSAIAEGLIAAHRTAWLTANLAGWQPRRELMIAAALLADCGFVTLCSAKRVSAEQLEREDPEAFRRHPSVSAALCAGLIGVPIELSTIVGRHHQRLDGKGYPDGLSAHGYSSSARLLAIVSRLRELEQVDAKQGAAPARLQQEADAGAWDPLLARHVAQLHSAAGSMPNTAPVPVPQRTQVDIAGRVAPGSAAQEHSSPPSTDQLRRDDAHTERTSSRAPGVSITSRDRQSA